MSNSKQVFFTLWLPLNENDFFHSTNKDNNPLDEGAINKSIEFFLAHDDFSIVNTSKLYLRENHQFSLRKDERYFIDIKKIKNDLEKLKEKNEQELDDSEKYTKTISNYLAEEILEKCDISSDDDWIKNQDEELISIGQNKISYISLDLKYKDLEFVLTFDSFGFYFFDFSKNKKDTYQVEGALNVISELFGGEYICHSMNREHSYEKHNICANIIEKNFKKGYFGILTHNQLLYLQEGIINFNLNHKIFFEIIKYENIEKDNTYDFLKDLLKEYSIAKFINKIIVGYSNSDTLKYSKPNLEKNKKIDFENISDRQYNFDFFTKEIIDKSGVSGGNEENEKNETLKHILIQDAIEEESMRRFLSIVLTYPYLEEIEDSVYVVRKRLTSKMMELSSDSEIDQLSFDSDVIKFLYSEEKLSNYIKLIVSKIPILFRIDNILRDAYYVKIGNLTDIDFTTDREQIDNLSLYRTWKGVLNTIQNNQDTLVNNLDSYNQMKLIKIEDESRRLLINSNDREDIKYAWEDKSNDNNIMSIFLIISALYYLTHSLDEKSTISLPIYFIFVVVAYIVFDKSKSSIAKWYKRIFWGNFSNKHNIEYRKKYDALDSIKVIGLNSINLLQELSKIKEMYIGKLNSIDSEYFFINSADKVKTINSSFSLINEDTYRLNLQLEIPRIRINHEEYDELQLFYVLTLDFKTTKYDRIDYFLDSAKIYYRLRKDSKIYTCFLKPISEKKIIKRFFSFINNFSFCYDYFYRFNWVTLCFPREDKTIQKPKKIMKPTDIAIIEKEIYEKFIDDLFKKK